MKKLLILLLFPLMMFAQDSTLTGDVDCSGEVNSQDAALILQYVTNVIDSLPCQQNLVDEIIINNYTGGSGFNISYPDGFGNPETIVIPEGENYIVPEGRNLYLYQGYYAEYEDFSIWVQPVNGWNNGYHPVIFEEGDEISAAINDISVPLKGFLVNKVVDVVHVLDEPFTVPENQIYCVNRTGLNGIDYNMKQYHFYFEGEIIEENDNYMTSGYLVDEDYFSSSGEASGGANSTNLSEYDNNFDIISFENIPYVPYISLIEFDSDNNIYVVGKYISTLPDYYPEFVLENFEQCIECNENSYPNAWGGLYVMRFDENGNFLDIFSKSHWYDANSSNQANGGFSKEVDAHDLVFDSSGDLALVVDVKFGSNDYKHIRLLKITSDLDLLIEDEEVHSTGYSPFGFFNNFTEFSPSYHLAVDSDDNFYLSGMASTGSVNTYTTTVFDFSFSSQQENYRFPFLVKLYNNFTPLWIDHDFFNFDTGSSNTIRALTIDDYGLNVFSNSTNSYSQNLVMRFNTSGDRTDSLVSNVPTFNIIDVIQGVDNVHLIGECYPEYPNPLVINDQSCYLSSHLYSELMTISIEDDFDFEINTTGMSTNIVTGQQNKLSLGELNGSSIIIGGSNFELINNDIEFIAPAGPNALKYDFSGNFLDDYYINFSTVMSPQLDDGYNWFNVNHNNNNGVVYLTIPYPGIFMNNGSIVNYDNNYSLELFRITN